MLSNIAKYYKVSQELNEKDKIKKIIKGIKEQIQNEKNFFNFLSLIGINCTLKLIKFCPGAKYDLLINKIYKSFENYFFTKSKAEINDNEDIIKLVEKKIKLSELIYPLIEKNKERDLVYFLYVVYIEDKLFFLFIILCLINNKMKIFLEYEEKSFSHLISLDKIIISFKEAVFSQIIDKISSNKILHIKLINDNFSFTMNDNCNNDFNSLNVFEISTFLLKGDKNEKKIINIKTYFKKIENNMDQDYLDELKTKIDNVDKRIDLLNKEIESLKASFKKEIESLKTSYKKERESLNQKFGKLKYDNNALKGRFIFKAFVDYIFLLFNIDFNLKYEEKKKLFKRNAKNKGLYYVEVFYIIQKMKDLYYKDTDISNKEYSLIEIKSMILEQFGKPENKFVEEFFNLLNPEKDIQIILRKNNELTQIMISPSNNEEELKEKKRKKEKIISEINGILSKEKKEKLISLLNSIIEEYN